MIIPATHGVRKDVDDLYGDHFTVALAQAMSRLECAPYWHQGEKAPARLVRAAELVRLSRVQLHDERTATVHGSTKAYDLTGYHCTCPQSQKGTTHWCVHAVAVKLARTLAEQVRPADPDDDQLGNGYPVDDETLPLPLPPTSVDERLARAQAHAQDTVYRGEALDMLAPPPQEEKMSEDSVEYIPEPDAAPGAVLEPLDRGPGQAQTVTIERPGGRPTTVPLAPQDDDLERALQVWTTQRQVVQRFLKQELVPGVDFYSLRIGNRDSKPSLSKAGAEKVLGWLRWSASFVPDTQTWDMLGRPQDVVIYICTLRTRSGEIVGEGRGARSLKKDGGDINKAMKMASKSAQVDAVLRTGCLSDCFTQDLEDLQETPDPTPARPSSQELRARIWSLVKAADPTVSTRDDVERYVHRATGYALHPDHYGAIVAQLEAR